MQWMTQKQKNSRTKKHTPVTEKDEITFNKFNSLMNEDDPEKKKVADIGETSKETEKDGTPLSEKEPPDECADQTSIEEDESLKETTEDD